MTEVSVLPFMNEFPYEVAYEDEKKYIVFTFNDIEEAVAFLSR